MEKGLRARALEDEVKALQKPKKELEKKCKAQEARIKTVGEENQ